MIIIDVLLKLWEYDIEVMSNMWMYIPLLIPAIGYIIFMLIKWYVLLIPVWLPLYIIFGGKNER